MPIPEGYTKLGLIGFVDRGNYSPDNTYMKGDVVFHEGSSYKILKDNLKGVTPGNDGVNYSYMAQGFTAAEATDVTAVDTHGITNAGKGKKTTVQNLLDVIAQKLVEKVVTSDTFQTVLAKYLVNNGLTTEAGKFGLDAAFGKNLQDQITQQNSNKLEFAQADKNIYMRSSSVENVGYIDVIHNNGNQFQLLFRFESNEIVAAYKKGGTWVSKKLADWN